MIDLASWLEPLDGENPSGEDLRNDARFHELERLAEPKVEVVHDERNRPTSQITTPGDWPAVLAKAEELGIAILDEDGLKALCAEPVAD